MSRRTVFRDIESLRAAGVPVEFDSGDKRYRIDDQHFLPPTNLTLAEALSLVVLAGRSSSNGDGRSVPPLFGAARDAAAKIESALPPTMQEQLRALSSSMSLREHSRNPLEGKQEVYELLVRASAEKRVARIRYDCMTEYLQYQTSLRVYHLTYYQRSWYAIGQSSRHREVRTFNLGRVLQAELLDKRFRTPKSFSIKSHLRNAWGLIPEPGPDLEVRLRFSSLVARNVAEVLWHPSQECAFTEDGSLEYRVTVSGLREIVWWVLGYGDQVEVLRPAKLRKLVAQRLQNAANLYPDIV